MIPPAPESERLAAPGIASPAGSASWRAAALALCLVHSSMVTAGDCSFPWVKRWPWL